MSEKRVVMVVDMQNGVFETPRHQREKCVSLINQLTQAADTVIFIQHTEAGGLEEGSEGFALLPRPPVILFTTHRLKRCYVNTEFVSLSSAAAPRITAWTRQLKTASVGATTLPWLRMPIPPRIARRLKHRF